MGRGIRKAGTYSDLHRVIDSARSYDLFAKRFRADKKYDDAAYCEGYANAYIFASLPTNEQRRAKPPLFFYFGFETEKESVLKRRLAALPQLHKAAFNFAKKTISKYPRNLDIVIHHADQLNVGRYMN